MAGEKEEKKTGNADKVPEADVVKDDIKQFGDGVKEIGEGTVDVVAGTVKTGADVAKLGAEEAAALITLPYKKRRNIADFFSLSRKGVITGAADNDPSAVVTYAQAGAYAGYSQLWLLLISTPMLIAIEEMTARIGVVTKKGLGRVMAEKFGVWPAFFIALLIMITNFIMIGADIAAMSNILGAILGINWYYLILPIGLIIVAFLITKGYAIISRYLFIVTLAFIAYIISGFLIHAPWLTIAHDTFVPVIQSKPGWWLVAVGLLGTTLSPYTFFWQATEEVQEGVTVKDLRKSQIGVTTGMIWCNLISFFIIITTATVFAGKNILLSSPQEAALALRPLAGNLSFALFSIGILGAGLVALPVAAATSAYVLSDVFNWRSNLDRKFSKAEGFYFVIILSILASGVMALFGVNPMLMLLYSQVIAAFLVPVLIILTLVISNSKEIMGEHKNRFWSNLGGWFSLIVMLAAIVMLVRQWIG